MTCNYYNPSINPTQLHFKHSTLQHSTTGTLAVLLYKTNLLESSGV